MDPANVGGRQLHPIASIAWVFRNLGGSRDPVPHCRLQLEAAPFLRGNDDRFDSAGEVVGVESRLPGFSHDLPFVHAGR